MKVLFLDIDGVLNHSGTMTYNPEMTRGLDEDKCEMLRQILDSTDVNVVLSSTWRHSNILINHIWDVVGDKYRERYIGNTPTIYNSYRHKEIQAYLDANEIDFFLILDDIRDMYHLKPYLLVTDDCRGLTKELTELAIKRFNECY